MNIADKKLIKKLVKDGDFKHHTSTCAYWCGISDEGVFFKDNNTACHAGLGYRRKNTKFIASGLQWKYMDAGKLEDKVIDAYLRWLTKTSPYATAFVLKGGSCIRKMGCVVVRTDIPANLMAGALVAARMLTEHHSDIPFIWYKLSQLGVHPDIAYCHAHQVKCDNEYENIAATDMPYQGHTAWYGASFKRSFVENFLKHEMPRAKGPYDKGYGAHAYTPIANMWAPKGEYVDEWSSSRRSSYLMENLPILAAIAERGEGAKASCNPFQKAKAVAKCPIDKFCQLWADLLKKEYGELNG